MDLFTGLFCSVNAVSVESAGSGADTREDRIKSIMIKSFEPMAHCEPLQSLSCLLACGIEIFRQCGCNFPASLIARERLVLIVWTFGDPWYGLIAWASRRGIEFPRSFIANLEELLSHSLRYFCRFTRPDFISHILSGLEPQDQFDLLHTEICSIMNGMMEAMRVSDSTLIIAPVQSYKVSCNLLPIVRKLVGIELSETFNPARLPPGPNRSVVVRDVLGEVLTAYAQSLGVELPVPATFRADFIRDMDEVRRAVQAIEVAAATLAVNNPVNVIRQRAMKAFWLTKLGSRLSVSRSDFCSFLQDYLISVCSSPADASAHVVGVVREGLKLCTDNGGQVDCLLVAKLTCSVHPDQTDFVLVISHVAYNFSNNIKSLLPPLVTSISQTFYSPGEELLLANSLRHPGWTAISGPKLSGKSHRLLQLLHSFSGQSIEQERDCVWIDFAGVDFDVDGVARVASQLFLRRCHLLTDLSTHFPELLRSLRNSAIVVFDNIAVDPTLSEDAFRSYSSFLRALFDLCKPFESSLTFVVVAENIFQLKSLVTFNSEVVVGPLDVDTAVEMASTLRPNLKRSMLIPVDPTALVEASSGLAGELASFATGLSIGSARALAFSIRSAGGDSVSIRRAKCVAVRSMFDQLTFDEKLLACCLFSDGSPFDESMCWHVSSGVFGQDQVRWHIAWTGLIDCGWVVQSTTLGYVVSPLVCLVHVTSPSINVQAIYDSYVLHWASELARINGCASECPSALEYFGQYLCHFKRVFEGVFRAAKSKPTPVPSTNALKMRKQSGGGGGAAVSRAFSFKSVVPKPEVGKYGEWVVEFKETSVSTAPSTAPEGVKSAAPHRSKLNWMRGRKSDSTSSDSDHQPNDVSSDSPRFLTRFMTLSSEGVGAVVKTVAGNLGRLLSYQLSPASGITVAFAFRRQLVPEDGESFDAAVIDLAEQYLRHGDIKDALKEMQQIVAQFYDFKTCLLSNPPAYASRALIVYGRLLTENKNLKAAQGCLSTAVSLFTERGQTVANNWECALATRLRDQLKAKIGEAA